MSNKSHFDKCWAEQSWNELNHLKRIECEVFLLCFVVLNVIVVALFARIASFDSLFYFIFFSFVVWSIFRLNQQIFIPFFYGFVSWHKTRLTRIIFSFHFFSLYCSSPEIDSVLTEWMAVNFERNIFFVKMFPIKRTYDAGPNTRKRTKKIKNSNNEPHTLTFWTICINYVPIVNHLNWYIILFFFDVPIIELEMVLNW